MSATLYFYLHTHWDREWYWSFGAYRTQLVSVIKNILHLLESGALDKFMLDGQTALIEDALEISPGLGPRIKSLVEKEKLSVGPWYVLADQMLVGGESLVRNLHYGLALSETFGGATRVGYCPDTFGHTADLPRILRGFGIDCAVVWRGVPPLKLSPLFDWKSPDGSEVLTLDLTQGYYQSAFGEGLEAGALAKYLLGFLGLEQDKKKDKLVEKDNPALTIVPQVSGALFPVGADHVGPQADFNAQVKAALTVMNDKKGHDKNGNNTITVKAETVSLTQFFEKIRAASDPGEPVRLIAGELRDNSEAFEYCRAYMLDGVLSTRLYLKRANRLSEHKILRQAEPFRALLTAHKVLAYSGEELNYNWKLLLKNQPHDSICGCSIDEVHREMQVRTASLNDGLDLLIAQGKEALLKSTKTKSEVRFGARHLDVSDPHLPFEQLLVFNPTTSPSVGPVRLRLALEDGKETKLPAGFQQISAHRASETFLGLSQVPVFKDVTIVDGYLDPGSVPAGTLKSVSLAPALSEKSTGSASSPAAVTEDSSAFGALKLSNEFFSLNFDKAGQLIARVSDRQTKGATRGGVKGKGPAQLGHRLVDVADAGDTYNFDPLADDSPVVARLVSVVAGQKGPLVSSLIAHYQIDLPEGLLTRGHLGKKGEAAEAPQLAVFERARVRIPHKIECEISLKKDVPIVFFETTMQNSAVDHRLEVVFDTPQAQEFTLSENHFALIKRYHDKKALLHPPVAASDLVDLGHEAPLTRYPCQRFFVVGDSTFMNLGLPEYGVGDSAVSITLLRAVSYLSRKRLRTRGGGAGPIMPTPEANCPGLMRATYAWAPTALAGAIGIDNVSNEAAPFVLADLFEGQPIAFVSPGGGVADKSLSLFAVDDPNIRVTSSYIDDLERLVIRLLNATSKPKSAFFTPPAGTGEVSLADLNGDFQRKLGNDSDSMLPVYFRLDFKPWQLLTVICRI